MLNIAALKKLDPKIVTLGSHPGIIQSILDFDWLAGKTGPSVLAIISAGKKVERYFWGAKEVVLPLYASLQSMPDDLRRQINLFLNFSSGRRTASSSLEALAQLPKLTVGSIFAEEVPEQESLRIWQSLQTNYPAGSASSKEIIGPSSVGLLIPGKLKLGAIAGVQAQQLVEAKAFTPGNVAVFSASGGMTNELINIVVNHDGAISFALSFGGDRFPIFTPKESVLAAEADPDTKLIVYYGELGGLDEYEIAELLKTGQVKKPIITFIAGVISEMFARPPQFGHAKAMAGSQDQSALAKRAELKRAGALVAGSYHDLSKLIKQELAKLKSGQKSGQKTKLSAKLQPEAKEYSAQLQLLQKRKPALFMSRISGEIDGEVQILGQDLLKFTKANSLGAIVGGLLIGRPLKSELMADFTELALKLLVDHGPYQSAAINTMVAARANKDLVSSLAAGLLTIGDRFGGAINGAAQTWFSGVQSQQKPAELVESFAAKREYILGIGHRKYRVGIPDPRVDELLKFKSKLKISLYTDYALAIAQITSAKKANLILNVDGTLAALLLDILIGGEGFSTEQLQEAIEIGLFNAYFVLSRSIGLTAHYLDQRRMDEGLFRLSPEHVAGI